MFNLKKIKKLEKENLELRTDIERKKTCIDYLKYEIKTITNKEIDLNNIDMTLSKKVYCENCIYYKDLYSPLFTHNFYCNSPFNQFFTTDFKKEKNTFSEKATDLNKYNNCNMYINKKEI